jgi:hypothetical protein
MHALVDVSCGRVAPIISIVVPEAQLRDDGAGIVPASPGWFVLTHRTRAGSNGPAVATVCR